MPEIKLWANEIGFIRPYPYHSQSEKLYLSLFLDEGHAKQLLAELNKLYPQEVENET